jgi:adenylate cyclase
MLVLPFANLSGDPSQNYLADVLAGELTTALSRLPGSFVIARSTAFTYKGKPVNVREVGRELGVRYVLEGSAEPYQKRVRVNAQLIDAGTGAHLWADQFDAERTDLLDMQDAIVTRLSRALQLQLLEVDAARVARVHPTNPDAEDLAMRCEAGVLQALPETSERDAGYALCARALQIDPHDSRALADYAFKFNNRLLDLQSSDREADIRQADALVSRALAADPNAYGAHFARAELLLAQRRFEEAAAESERTLALNPSAVNAYGGLSLVNSFLGRPQQALEYADKAIRLSPRDPLLYVFQFEKGMALALLHRDQEALEWLRQAAAGAPQWPLLQVFLAATLSLTGQEAEARAALARYLALGGAARTLAQWRAQLPSHNPVFLSYAERFAEGLRKAGMPEQ